MLRSMIFLVGMVFSHSVAQCLEHL